MDGVIVVDKPEGWTSHDAVNKVRRLVGTRKVGHLGTLDPLATGVLPLVVGRATRLAQFLMRGDKTYDAVVRFGYSTDTYDRDGVPTCPVSEPELDRARLETVLQGFQGLIRQMPPPISAKKVGGTPAYRLVRRKIPVELKPVEVTVYSVEVLSVQGPEARLLVRCSQGTYMRSIAHDLGQALGCGGFLKSLRRLASGDFRIEQARTIPELEELARAGRLEEALIPAAELLPQFPSETVDSLTARQIRQGRDFRVSPFRDRAGARYIKAVTPDGQLVAIGEQKLPNLYHPCVVL
ncbi:MAG: tRNA pseudouridine(55) synthase TruB [Bryobacterales bacterium]|nr:tRNA pseudouridine(55) synthase TruB [Bryobacteraceae bacterium]MDW8354227.1 tRNA pseudouridine(55) synthase TruB [Bryobacterales bacterium]